jgi:polyisoprenoid-binding protein YceI
VALAAAGIARENGRTPRHPLIKISEIVMRFRIALVMLFICATPAAWADSYTIDPTHTFPAFAIDHLGFSTQRGRFNSTQGKLTLDQDKKTGSVEISIDAASIDTGLAKLEEILRSEDYFDVEQYPTLTFRGDDFRFDDARLVAVNGNLTLLGVTLPVSLNITRFKCGFNVARLRNMCGADAVAVIQRSDFGMRKGVPFVGDEVKISIQIEAVRD